MRKELPLGGRRFGLMIAGVLCIAANASAQDTPTVPIDSLRVVLECASCPLPLVRQRLPYVQWVSDTARAHVHVIADDAHATMAFVGMQNFSGKTDTLALVADSTAGARRDQAVIRLLQLGLARYLAATEIAGSLSVVAAPPPQVPAAAVARRWTGAVDLGFTGSAGNSRLIALSTGVRVRHLQTKLFKLEGALTFRYGESDGRVAARHLQGTINFDMGPDARFAPFVSASAERDPFRKFDLRSKVGSGMRLALHNAPKSEASVRAAIQYNHERFIPSADLPANSDGTWSMEFKGNKQIGSTLKLENSSTYNPVISDFEDYVVEAKSKISTRITSRLALTLAHNYSYDSRPVPGVRHADQRFQAGLTIEL